MAKKIKILLLLLVVLLALPGYYRNKVPIDRNALQAWYEVKSWWGTESPETKRLREALSHPLSTGSRGKSVNEANAEAIIKSQDAIEAQLNKENAKPPPP